MPVDSTSSDPRGDELSVRLLFLGCLDLVT